MGEEKICLRCGEPFEQGRWTKRLVCWDCMRWLSEMFPYTSFIEGYAAGERFTKGVLRERFKLMEQHLNGRPKPQDIVV